MRLPRRLFLACTLILILLSACSPLNVDAAPTINVQAIYTSAYQTFAAQDLTAQATLTSTAPAPSPTAHPTLSSAGPSTCDGSAFIADVTVPDGTAIAAGASFTKTWTLQNTGTCAWSTSYKLVFSSGDRLEGTEVFVPALVPAGGQTSLSVNMVAPSAAGTYKGFWRMQNANGLAFGDTPYVEIAVGGPPAASGCRAKSPRSQITIAGHAGPEAVTIDYGIGTTLTDPNGNYAFTVPYGWSGTVTPSKARVHPWTFEPEHLTYTNVTCDLIRQNFKATPPPGV